MCAVYTMKLQKHTTGLSLLETLLATMVMAALVLGVFGLLSTYAKRELGRANARLINSVTDAMRRELADLSIFDAYYAASGGLALQVSLNPADPCPNLLRTCTLGGVSVPPARLLTSTFSNRGLAKTNTLRLILVPITDTRPLGAYYTNALRSFEIVVADDTATPLEDAANTILELGARGGQLSFTNLATATATSRTGSWSLPLAGAATPLRPGLLTTGWATSLPAGTANNETIIVSYDFISRAESSGDYLYRTQQTNTSLNTMYADISMGQKNIVGADAVSVGTGGLALKSMNIRGATAFESNATFNGTTQVVRNLPNGAADAANTMSAVSAQNMAMSAPTPQISILGDAQISTLNVGQSINANSASFIQITADTVVKAGITTPKSLNGTFKNVYFGNTILTAPVDALNITSTDPTKGKFVVGRANNATIMNKNIAVAPPTYGISVGSANGPAGGITTLSTDTLTTDDLWLDTNVKLTQFGHCAEGCD